MSTEQIIEAALNLPPEERAKVWARLEASFEQAEEDEELDAEEMAACQRRLRELDEGRSKAIPGPEALERLFGKKHAPA